jgi:serine/threonine protein kinase
MTPHTANTTCLDILEINEAYEEVNGVFQSITLVVYRDGNNTYHATSKARVSVPPKLNINDLTNKILIPAAAYRPPFPSNFTCAPNPLPSDTYVKRPSLISYDRVCQGPQPARIANDLLAEVRICELMKQNPHPNIARYLGCQVTEEKIDGICFPRYGQTLMQAVNPRSFMKRKLSETRQGLGEYSPMLEYLEDGVKHLHSLGLVHNDINPSNIMIDGKWPVIIDFGSCRHVGESLDDVGRTYEWFDETVQTSLFKNDLDALHEIRIWLRGGQPDEFQFAE